MNRLEFQELRDLPKNTEFDFATPVDVLQPSITQRFVQLFARSQNRLLLKTAPGTGKTIMSLLTTKEDMRVFSTIYRAFEVRRKIVVFGFSEDVFKRELTRHKEFGFVTDEELAEMRDLRKQLKKGQSADIKGRLDGLQNAITRRLSDPAHNGFFIFYGYRKWFLRLFLSADLPPDVTSENVYERYKKGELAVNQAILDSLKGAKIICDEIHLAYNSLEANSYGIALQLLLDYHGDNITAIFMSATIINNSKREIIDIANLIRSPGTPIFPSRDFFDSNATLIGDLSPIYKQFQGKTVFLEESTADYPAVKYRGEEIEELGGFFTKCEMSKMHKKAYKDADPSNWIAEDMVFPSPSGIGLVSREAIDEQLGNADPSWLKSAGITITKHSDHIEYGGDWLRMPRLAEYSGKYAALVTLIHAELKRDPLQKFLIYHPYIVGSGVELITNILLENGFIRYGGIPNDHTLSSEAYITRAKWDNKQPFRAATVFALTNETNNKRKREFLTLWNSPAENTGKTVKIFVGAQRIRQSIDSRNTPHLIKCHVCTNKAEEIQVIGRIVRTNSMSDLPLSKRVANIHTLIYDGPTNEYKKYYRQFNEFKFIREIEWNINKSAVNNFIYRKDFSRDDPNSALPFSVDYSIPKTITSASYYNEHYQYALGLMMRIIKWGFIANAVWSYERMWEFVVSHPAANVYFDGIVKSMRDVYREMYSFAMYSLVYKKNQAILQLDIFNQTANVFRTQKTSKGLYKTIDRVIAQFGDYFMLVPIDEKGVPILGEYAHMTRHYKTELSITDVPNDFKQDKVDEFRQYVAKSHSKFAILLDFDLVDQLHMIKMHIEGTLKLPSAFVKMYEGLGVISGNSYRQGDTLMTYTGSWRPSTAPPQPPREFGVVMGVAMDKQFKLIDEPSGNQAVGDKRLVKQGRVCTTIKRDELARLAAKISVPNPPKKVQELCTALFERLVELQINFPAIQYFDIK